MGDSSHTRTSPPAEANKLLTPPGGGGDAWAMHTFQQLHHHNPKEQPSLTEGSGRQVWEPKVGSGAKATKTQSG